MKMGNLKIHYIFLATALACQLNLSAQDSYGEMAEWFDIYNAVLRELAINYVDTIDYERINQSAIAAMLRTLDPYTTFFAESEEETLKMMTTGAYGGIGAIIMQRGDHVMISEPYEGMPAQRNDVRAGDIILEVDGQETKGMKTDQVSQLLRGPQSTEVSLLLQREGERKPFRRNFAREVIQINPVSYHGMLSDSIGYIALCDFTETSATEFRNALADLSKLGMRRLVVDLRNNGGGLVSQAVDIAGLFVPKHTPIVSTKGLQKQNCIEYKTTTEPLYPDLPLAIIINSESASAAEILAGSLQDIDRAVITGERSFGKGLVQTLRRLPYNTYLKVTTSKYYIPSGRCVQAIDYAKRQTEGAQRIPDSLTNEFATRNGRLVRDGGGITPDVEFEPRKEVNIAYYLYRDNILFDYATQYAIAHKTIATPDIFALTDDEYAAFVHYVEEKNFTYELHSERMLDELREMVQAEGYLADSDSIIAQLKTVLKPNVERDLMRFRSDVEEALCSEIVQRYYFQRGVAQYELRTDKWLHNTLNLLADDARYRAILIGTEK